MLLPSVFGNDFFEDLMNFPTWDRPARDAHRELRRMEHEFNGIGGLMRTDVKEDKEGYEVHIDLPGFKKEDVQITLKDGYMTVAASRVNEVEEGKNYLRRERYVGNVSRSFYVGEVLTEEDIKAKFENGVLKITLPKKEEVPKVEEPKHIAIEG
ncbi:MAG: Hsp20/alpha crystallin family protein [Lachnospiraceae bacterium]|nr:Hsp20/alpha crystallin family protein [Lachnospiraceae bacterium]